MNYSPPELEEFAGGDDGVCAIAITSGTGFTVRNAGGVESVNGATVSAQFFDRDGRCAGNRPRVFGDDSEPIVVISDRLRRRLFGGNGEALGQSMPPDRLARSSTHLHHRRRDAAGVPVSAGARPMSGGRSSSSARPATISVHERNAGGMRVHWALEGRRGTRGRARGCGPRERSPQAAVQRRAWRHAREDRAARRLHQRHDRARAVDPAGCGGTGSAGRVQQRRQPDPGTPVRARPARDLDAHGARRSARETRCLHACGKRHRRRRRRHRRHRDCVWIHPPPAIPQTGAVATARFDRGRPADLDLRDVRCAAAASIIAGVGPAIIATRTDAVLAMRAGNRGTVIGCFAVERDRCSSSRRSLRRLCCWWARRFSHAASLRMIDTDLGVNTENVMAAQSTCRSAESPRRSGRLEIMESLRRTHRSHSVGAQHRIRHRAATGRRVSAHEFRAQQPAPTPKRSRTS